MQHWHNFLESIQLEEGLNGSQLTQFLTEFFMKWPDACCSVESKFYFVLILFESEFIDQVHALNIS